MIVVANIRKARLEDAHAITELAAENAIANLDTPQMKHKGFLVSNYSKEQYETFIHENELFYVLEDSGKIQGFLLAFHDYDLNYDNLVNKRIRKHAKNNFVVIKQICIRREVRKQGYGRMLYEYLMSSVDKDIFLAVVLEPYNEASVHFHDKLGFKQVFTVHAEDQMKRGIYYWNNPHNVSHYDKEIIIDQYEHAVNLYKHEDSLNWSKINHLFYITGGLFGIISLLANVIKDINELFYIFLLVTSILGIVSTLMFQVTINNGVEYLQRRKITVVDIEKILMQLGGVDIVSVNFNHLDKRFKQSPTTMVMKLIPKIITFIWCGILITSLIFLFI